jgi:hypothetical protein
MGDAAYYNYPYTEFTQQEPLGLGYARRGFGPPFGPPQTPPEDKNKADVNDIKKKDTTVLVIVIVIASVVILTLIALTIYFAVRKTTVTPPILSGVLGACSSDRNCQANLVCSLGGCAIAPGGSCTANNQCPNNYTCENGTCTGGFFATCAASANCSQPWSCMSNLCSEGECNNMCSAQTCSTSADCADPTTEYCYEGNCLMKLQQPCSSDLQCQFYGDFATCVANRCLGLGGTACSHNADCQSGTCASGVCSCNSNSQCPTANPTCTSNVCV